MRDAASLEPVRVHADYLNPEPDDGDDGLPNLVDKSLQTTRRFDALKLFVSLRAHGRRFLGRAMEATLDLAAQAARLIDADPGLELGAPPSLNTVLFSYVGPGGAGAEQLDAANEAIRSSLLHSGQAVIARTRLDGRVLLKLTLMNPDTVLGRSAKAAGAGRRRGRAGARARAGVTWRADTPPWASSRRDGGQGGLRPGSAATRPPSCSPSSAR